MKQRISPSRWRLLVFSLMPVVLLLLAGEGICRALRLPREPNRLIMKVGLAGCYFRTLEDSRLELCEPTNIPGAEVRFSPHKSPGTCRVAFLGASSVRIPGKPLWPERIAGLDPRIEVLNLGIPGVNSASVTLRAEAVKPYDVDAYVVYTGHNDVAQGIYVGGRDRAAISSLRWIRLRLLLDRSALYRTLLSVIAPLEPVKRGSGEPGIEQRTALLYDDADRKRLGAVLAENLEQLIKTVSPRPVLLVVPASNPQWPPTGTLVPENEAAAGEVRMTLEAARTQLEAGRPEEAQAELDRAFALVPQSAYGWWLQARVYARTGQSEKATEAFGRSRDLDALPMRATTEVEEAIRGRGAVRGGAAVRGSTQARRGAAVPGSTEAREGSAVRVIDLPQVLSHPDGLLDAGYFFDNLHFSEEGNAEVARLLLPEIQSTCGLGEDSPSTPSPPAPYSR